MDDWSDDEIRAQKQPIQKSGNDDWDDNDNATGSSNARANIQQRSFTEHRGENKPPRREPSSGDYKDTYKIPGRMTGRIVGSGGQVIRELSTEFSVKINIAKEEDDDGMKDVEVIGDEPNVINCIEAIKQKVSGGRSDRESNHADEFKDSIKIEGRMTGRIVGSGGSVIRELSTDFSVKINIAKEEDDDGMKDVEVIGGESNVIKCIEAIKQKVSGGGRSERPPRDHDNYAGSGDYDEKIVIESRLTGRLIGPQGAVINELQSEHNVKIDIGKEDNDDGKKDVKVSGSEENVKKAIKAINAKIGGGGEGGNDKPREQYIPPEPVKEDELYGNEISAGINFDNFDKIDVSVTGEGAELIKPVSSFEEMNLRPLLFDNVKRSGYPKPTPIQKHAIPIIMAKRDLMGCAQTGSGKTAAFILPILHSIIAANKTTSVGQPICLVVAPTRELVIQISEEARKFGNTSCVKVCLAYGGTVSRHQGDNINKGCHILVATPGRLCDFVSRGLVSYEALEFLVLDEADRMLDMGFSSKVDEIIEHSSFNKENVQTLLFSATFPDDVQRMAAKYLRNYLFLTVGIVGGASTDVEQEVLEVVKSKKRTKLMEILDDYVNSAEEDRILVFVETKQTADYVASFLSETKISSTSIHGDRMQSERETALREFRSGKRKVLTATSVAARGLDIKGVTHVINYDLPKNVEDYVHRIGRTGRVGNRGKATSFFDSNFDKGIAGDLAKVLKDAKQTVPDFLGSAGTGSLGNDGYGGVDIRAVSAGKKQENDDEDW